MHPPFVAWFAHATGFGRERVSEAPRLDFLTIGRFGEPIVLGLLVRQVLGDPLRPDVLSVERTATAIHARPAATL
jgi:hypothetical protein